jgi:hypothetical protein
MFGWRDSDNRFTCINYHFYSGNTFVLTFIWPLFIFSSESVMILHSELKRQRKLVKNLKKKSLWSKNLEEVIIFSHYFLSVGLYLVVLHL